MSLRSESDTDPATARGLFALVTYLPDPLGASLSALRQTLPAAGYPEAHITFLPPRPLPLSIDAAVCDIEKKLRCVKPFEIELGGVHVFPQTGILYLNIEGGFDDLVRLHACLNEGVFSAPENFEFIPHLTLAGPIVLEDAPAQVQRVSEAWAKLKLDRRFRVDELVLLWQAANDTQGDWTRIYAHSLLSAC